MKTGYYIYDFERGSFFNQNNFGYAKNENSIGVGLFDYEDAMKIVKNANIVNIEAEMVHNSDVERLNSIKKEIGVKNKRPLEEVFWEMTEKYYPENPFARVIMALEKEGHYLENEPEVRSLYNDENQRFQLFFEGNNTGLNMVITRMGTGSYEVIGNRLSYKNDVNQYQTDFKKIIKENIDVFVSDIVNQPENKSLSDRDIQNLFGEYCIGKLQQKYGDNHFGEIPEENKFVIHRALTTTEEVTNKLAPKVGKKLSIK